MTIKITIKNIKYYINKHLISSNFSKHPHDHMCVLPVGTGQFFIFESYKPQILPNLINRFFQSFHSICEYSKIPSMVVVWNRTCIPIWYDYLVVRRSHRLEKKKQETNMKIKLCLILWSSMFFFKGNWVYIDEDALFQ